MKSPILPFYHRVISIFIIFTIVIGIFLRFANLESKVYWIDEVNTSVRVAGYAKEEFKQLVPSNRVIKLSELQAFQTVSSSRSWSDTFNALTQNAEHSPLFYLTARLWMQWFDSSITNARSLAAVISLFTFPAMVWLCYELFQNLATGYIASAFLAVSPLQILYAQEAREYSLFAVFILVSSAALLRALRLSSRSPQKGQLFSLWGSYALTVAIALYSHFLAAITIVGHGIYVVLLHRKQIKAYLIAAFSGFLTFLPWIIIYLLEENTVGRWSARAIPVFGLIKRWLFNCSVVFFDFQNFHPNNRLIDVEAGQDALFNFSQPEFYLQLVFLGMVGYSIFFLCRTTVRRIYLFVLIVILINSLTFVIPDLVSGGQRSGIARYLMGCYLGIQICMAHLFAQKLLVIPQGTKTSIVPPRIWKIVFAGLLSLGVISGYFSLQAETWWNKYSSFYNAQTAEFINGVNQAIVISSNKRSDRLATLSYKLKPEVKLLLFDAEQEFDFTQLEGKFDNIFLFRPNQTLIESLETNSTGKIISVFPKGNLWKWCIADIRAK
ncbi:MAG: glycosyltransferase family 39 protein [Xenococcus sp. (in: cyanobacteria)]